MRKILGAVLSLFFGMILLLGTFTSFVPNVRAEGVTIDLNLPKGWSMFSLPVLPANQVLSELFHEARVVYGYEKGVGYVRVKEPEELKGGKGYWILFEDAQNYLMTGQPIQEYPLSVIEGGWEMIGGCTSPAQASADNANIIVIYGYVPGTGYQRVLKSENLMPGKGYWICLSNSTRIRVDSGWPNSEVTESVEIKTGSNVYPRLSLNNNEININCFEWFDNNISPHQVRIFYWKDDVYQGAYDISDEAFDLLVDDADDHVFGPIMIPDSLINAFGVTGSNDYIKVRLTSSNLEVKYSEAIYVDILSPLPKIIDPVDGTVVEDPPFRFAVNQTNDNDGAMTIWQIMDAAGQVIFESTSYDTANDFSVSCNRISGDDGEYTVRAFMYDAAGNYGTDQITIFLNFAGSFLYKKVRLHAVVTGNDGTSGPVTPTYTGSFTRQTVIQTVEELKTIYKKAGILIQFDPKADITEVHNALLNEDCPFQGGKIVVPPMSVDDLVNNPNVLAQRGFAENLEGSMVIYFRDFSEEKYTYIDPNGQEKRDTPWHFSGSQHLYVRYSKSFEPPRLAHEMGHYLHLWHTFRDPAEDIATAASMIRTAVENGEVSKATGTMIFDGDYGSGVNDTLPDPRGGFMAYINGGDACGPVSVGYVPVIFSDSSYWLYYLAPDRLNIMSYFQACQSTSTARFSPDQKKRMMNVLTNENRQHLLDQLPGTYTAVFKPGTQDERMIYGWKYEYFRMKYDELWNEGWRLHLLENHVVNGEVLYSAVFRKTYAPEIQLYGWSYSDYRSKYDELWNEGWRLHILNNYVVNGNVRYTAVFHNTGGGEIQLYGWSYDDYRSKYDELWDDGWRLHILNNYVVNGNVRYTAVFRNTGGGEIQLYGWSYSDYRNEYDELWNHGWRLHILNNYVVNGSVRYTAVFRNTGGSEIQLYGWKYRQLREKAEELWDQGMRLHTLNIY
jgi:hypothetical protein